MSSQSLVAPAIPTTVAGVVVEPSVAPAEGEQMLATYNAAAVGQGLDFFDRFAGQGDAQAILVQVARQQLGSFLANPSSIISYGVDVLDEVVANTQAIMKFTEGVKLPSEDDAALRDLKVQLDKAGGYDMSVAGNLAKYREMKEKIGKRFGGGKAKEWFAAFEADRMSLEQLTDEMSGDFIARAKHRAVAANQTRQLFEANRESLGHLEERVAVLEKVREGIEQQRAALPTTLQPDDPRANEAAGMDTALRMLDVKVTNLAARWYTGMGLDPMLRALQEQQIMMSMRLNDIGTTGMEKIRLILAQYAMSLDLQRDADSVAAFDEMDNLLTQQMFKQTRATIGQVAHITTRSGVSSQTVSVIASEVAGMVDDVSKAYATARADNQAKISAMMAGVKVMESAQDRPVDQALVGAVVNEANRSRSHSLVG